MFENQEIEKLFSKRPLKKNISEVKLLKNFTQSYPDETLKPNLEKLVTERQYYRAVNGDGNCFYRATIFLYLKWADLRDFQGLFTLADLLKCKNLPFKVCQYVTSQNLLYYLWKTELQPLADLSPQNRQKRLQEIINRSEAVDAILIAYFRVLNYNQLLVNKQEYQLYIPGGVQNELNKILTFGDESQGVQLYTFSKTLDLQILVMMVHQQNLTGVIYPGKSNRIQLFYRPGHYDILCDKQQPIQSQDIRQQISFTQFLKQQKNSSNNFDQEAKKFNKSTSRIISVSQPSELSQILSHRNRLSSQIKVPQTSKQFIQGLRQQNSKLAKSQATLLESQSFKRSQEKSLQSNEMNRAVEIKSVNFQKKDQIMKSRMLKQAFYCVFGLIILTMGIFSV